MTKQPSHCARRKKGAEAPVSVGILDPGFSCAEMSCGLVDMDYPSAGGVHGLLRGRLLSLVISAWGRGVS